MGSHCGCQPDKHATNDPRNVKAGYLRTLAAAADARLIEVGEQWADLDASASLFEELRKSVLGKLVLEFIAEGMPAGKAEHAAYASVEYQEHVRAMVEARRKATRARVRWDTGRAHVELMRSAESTKRAEMALR